MSSGSKNLYIIIKSEMSYQPNLNYLLKST